MPWTKINKNKKGHQNVNEAEQAQLKNTTYRSAIDIAILVCKVNIATNHRPRLKANNIFFCIFIIAHC